MPYLSSSGQLLYTIQLHAGLGTQSENSSNIHYLCPTNYLSLVAGRSFSVDSTLPVVPQFILALALLLLPSRSTLVNAVDTEPIGWRINPIIRAMSFSGRCCSGLAGSVLMEDPHLVVSEDSVQPRTVA